MPATIRPARSHLPPLTRRAFTAGAAGAALLLTACDPDGTPALPGLERPAEAADHDLAVTALEDEHEAAVLVELVRRRHPELRGPLADLHAAHRAHVRLLTGTADDVAPGQTSRPRVPAAPAKALAAVVAAERSLAGRHVRAAVAARSGAFAQVLASLAASAEQHAAALPARAPRAGGGS